jgi:hypothetical protein
VPLLKLIGWLLLIAAVPLLVAQAVVSLAVFLLVKRLEGKSCTLNAASGGRLRKHAITLEPYESFANEQEMSWVGGYTTTLTKRLFLAAWKHEPSETLFCVYCSGQRVFFEFVTELAESRKLTTSNTKWTHFFPNRPSQHVQSFVGVLPVVLWKRHQKGLEYLEAKFDARPVDSQTDFDVRVIESIKQQMSYVRTLPAWLAQPLYWLVVRRTFLTNRSIKKQSPTE